MELDLKVIAGPACSESLIADVEKRISELRGEEFKRTPWSNRVMKDGEIVPQINQNVRGCDVYIIQSTNSPAINHEYLKLLLQAATLSSAFSVTAVIPYMGGLRQDCKDKPRVPITAKLHAVEIGNAMEGAPRRHVMLLHPHFKQVQGYFGIPSDILMPTKVFMRVITELFHGDFTRLNPSSVDINGGPVAETYMRAMDLNNFAIGDKRRLQDDKPEVRNIIGLLPGYVHTIHDDIIDTAGSVYSFCEKARAMDVNEFFAFMTHGVLPSGSIETVRASGVERLYITDSIRHPDGYLPEDLVTVVPCGELIGEAIFKNNTNGSISDMEMF